MVFNKKAQQVRDDLFMWYGVCVVIVLLVAGGLYSAGVIGPERESSIDSKVTAAVVKEPDEQYDMDDSDNAVESDGNVSFSD